MDEAWEGETHTGISSKLFSLTFNSYQKVVTLARFTRELETRVPCDEIASMSKTHGYRVV